jgi:hypothetical protein
VVGSVNQDGDSYDVSDDIGGRSKGRSVVTVGTDRVRSKIAQNGGGRDLRDSIEQLLDGVVGDNEPRCQLRLT